MATAALIKIGPSERPWANPPNPRAWQNFWGVFECEPTTGLYIEHGSDISHKKNLVSAFQKLPPALRDVCLEWRVTFNFAELITASGHASTFYGDFSRGNKREVSPHVELGKTSLTESLILPHLGHELGHLYWRTRSETEKEQWRQYLKESCSQETIEVTPYLQEIYQTHLSALKFCNQRGSSVPANTASFDRWVEESFCETIAVLIAPDYPSYDHKTTVDVVTRKIVIALAFGLFS